MKNYPYDADFIAQKLPQKYPFLLVDRVVEYQAGKKIVCLKNVTQNEEYFMGHFPERKIMPGVLISEALAQTCALLGILDQEQKAGASQTKASPSPPEIGFLASMNIKFMEPVFPGDQLYLQARCLRAFEGLQAFDVEAVVNNYTVCKGVIKTTLRGADAEGKEK